MKNGLFRILAMALIASFSFFVSCGDDDKTTNPTDDTSYISAKITGNYVNNAFTTSRINYSVTNNVITLKTIDSLGIGDISLKFPVGVTGTFQIDSVNYASYFWEPTSTYQIKYSPKSGSITIETNNSSKLKGTFEFNGKTSDEKKSVVVSEGKFQYIIK